MDNYQQFGWRRDMRKSSASDDTPCLTVSMAAEMTGLSHSQIRKLADSGTVPCVRYPESSGRGVTRRFRPRDIKAFIDQHSFGITPPAATSGTASAAAFRRKAA
jgi:hypothetical protein